MPQGLALAGWIDHTLLKADATPAQAARLFEEARAHQFATVCVNPVYVERAAQSLLGTQVGICAVISFPLGAHAPTFKAQEARHVIEKGATEIDMVIHIGALKGGLFGDVLDDVATVTQACHAGGAHLKVILEMCYLTRREKIIACLLSQAAGADFVKTSTGFGPGGATTEDVELMRRVVGAQMGVKAAGGIRTLADAQKMIAAGANRLGASASVSILNESVAGAGA